MSGEFGTGKTIFVLAIVVGCFAVLWPKIFYPMLTASISQSGMSRQGVKWKKTESVQYLGKLCYLLEEYHAHATPGSAQRWAFDGQCLAQIKESCNIVLTEAILDGYRLGKDESNFTECLHTKYGLNSHVVSAAVPPVVRPRLYQNNMGGGARPERPSHLHPDMMHPALREKGRAMPQRTIDKQARPGPMPGVRPPMGGAGGPVPPPQGKGSGAMGIIMPLYTVGIIIFFIYTIMKVLFKKSPDDDDKAPKIKNFHMDPEYRKYVFCEEYLDSGNAPQREHMRRLDKDVNKHRRRPKVEQIDPSIEDEQMDQLRRRLEDTERAMERLMSQMGSVSDKLTAAKITEVLSQAQAQAKLLKLQSQLQAACDDELTTSEDITSMTYEDALFSSTLHHKVLQEVLMQQRPDFQNQLDDVIKKGMYQIEAKDIDIERNIQECNKHNTKTDGSKAVDSPIEEEISPTPEQPLIVNLLTACKFQAALEPIGKSNIAHQEKNKIANSPIAAQLQNVPQKCPGRISPDSDVETPPNVSDLEDMSSDATETGADVSELHSFADSGSHVLSDNKQEIEAHDNVQNKDPVLIMPKFMDVPEVTMPKIAELKVPEITMPKLEETKLNHTYPLKNIQGLPNINNSIGTTGNGKRVTLDLAEFQTGKDETEKQISKSALTVASERVFESKAVTVDSTIDISLLKKDCDSSKEENMPQVISTAEAVNVEKSDITPIVSHLYEDTEKLHHVVGTQTPTAFEDQTPKCSEISTQTLQDHSLSVLELKTSWHIDKNGLESKAGQPIDSVKDLTLDALLPSETQLLIEETHIDSQPMKNVEIDASETDSAPCIITSQVSLTILGLEHNDAPDKSSSVLVKAAAPTESLEPSFPSIQKSEKNAGDVKTDTEFYSKDKNAPLTEDTSPIINIPLPVVDRQNNNLPFNTIAVYQHSDILIPEVSYNRAIQTDGCDRLSMECDLDFNLDKQMLRTNLEYWRDHNFANEQNFKLSNSCKYGHITEPVRPASPVPPFEKQASVNQTTSTFASQCPEDDQRLETKPFYFASTSPNYSYPQCGTIPKYSTSHYPYYEGESNPFQDDCEEPMFVARVSYSRSASISSASDDTTLDDNTRNMSYSPDEQYLGLITETSNASLPKSISSTVAVPSDCNFIQVSSCHDIKEQNKEINETSQSLEEGTTTDGSVTASQNQDISRSSTEGRSEPRLQEMADASEDEDDTIEEAKTGNIDNEQLKDKAEDDARWEPDFEDWEQGIE